MCVPFVRGSMGLPFLTLSWHFGRDVSSLLRTNRSRLDDTPTCFLQFCIENIVFR